MRLENLEIFITVADCKSMIKAVDVLHLSQQIISLSIRSLENELQKTLFVRSKKGSFLTLDGQEVYKTSQEILTKVSSLYPQKSEPTKNVLPMKLSIIHIPACSHIVNKLVSTIHHRYPSSKFFTEELDAYQVNTQYLANPSDSQILITNIDEAFCDNYKNYLHCYDVYLISRSRLKCATSLNSSLSRKKQISLYTLAKFPYIVFSSNASSTESFFSDLLKSYNIQLSTVISANSSSVISNYLENNMGYSLTTDYAANSLNYPNPNVLIPLKQKIYILYLILFPKVDSLEMQLCKTTFEKLFPESNILII